MKIRALLPLFLAIALPATAQNVVLDEGTFRVQRAGQDVGTETFTIRRVGQGAEAHVIANAVIELDLPAGHEQVKPLLRTASDLSLSAYQLEVAGGEPIEIAITANGRRFLARTRTPSGEQEREFRATPGGVLLEDGVAHQYWFLSQLAAGTDVTVLVPRAGRQDRIVVRAVQPDGAGRYVSFEINGSAHEVWYDAEGRVLRVVIPATGFSAERTTR